MLFFREFTETNPFLARFLAWGFGICSFGASLWATVSLGGVLFSYGTSLDTGDILHLIGMAVLFFALSKVLFVELERFRERTRRSCP